MMTMMGEDETEDNYWEHNNRHGHHTYDDYGNDDEGDEESPFFNMNLNLNLTGSDDEDEGTSPPPPYSPSSILTGPSLEEAVAQLKWGVWIHAYGFAFMFFFLAFYSFFSVLNLRSQISSRPYMTTINSFLCLLGSSRAIVLFVDPYGLQSRLPPMMGCLLWDLGFPSLISSFSLIQIAFLQLTQGEEEGSEDSLRRKTSCISFIISLHFLGVIVAGIVSSTFTYNASNGDLLLARPIVQLFFATWGSLLCGSFLIAGNRILNFCAGRDSPNSNSGNVPHEKGIANLFGAMMGAPSQNLASSLTAALAPTLLQGGNKGGSSSSSSTNPNTSSTTTKPSTSDSSSSSTAGGNPIKIKITDEHERTFSVASAESSTRLNDIPEEGPAPPVPSSTSPRSSFSAEGGPGTAGYVRPPSPVLPRRKSSTSSARGSLSGPGGTTGAAAGPRRLSWRRDSASNSQEGGQLSPTVVVETTEGVRKKSLTWGEDQGRRASRKSFDEGSAQNERNGGETLLSTAVGTDYTLQSILSHIAYVNQAALDYRLSRKLSRTNQAHKVLKYTSVTAFLGFLVCLTEMIRLLSPLGLLAYTSTSPPPIWLWIGIHTIHRLLEFAMGSTIANITKQNRAHHPHYAYSMRQRGMHKESLYL